MTMNYYNDENNDKIRNRIIILIIIMGTLIVRTQ